MQQARARVLRLTLLVAALAVAAVLSRRWPTDHSVHVVLGDASPLVREVRVRYGDVASAGAAPRDDWQREVSFQYAAGRAPRVVSHEPRLVSGDYDVEVEVRAAGPGGALRTVTTTRRVLLDRAAASVDVSAIVRDSLSEPAPPTPPPPLP